MILHFISLYLFHLEIKQAMRKGDSFIYSPGWQGHPIITLGLYRFWQRFFKEETLVYYSSDGTTVDFVFIFTNPADVWWRWHQFKKTTTANRDEVLKVAPAVELKLSAFLTHRYRLHLEDYP